jgi:hypothetical protein
MGILDPRGDDRGGGCLDRGAARFQYDKCLAVLDRLREPGLPGLGRAVHADNSRRRHRAGNSNKARSSGRSSAPSNHPRKTDSSSSPCSTLVRLTRSSRKAAVTGGSAWSFAGRPLFARRQTKGAFSSCDVDWVGGPSRRHRAGTERPGRSSRTPDTPSRHPCW